MTHNSLLCICLLAGFVPHLLTGQEVNRPESIADYCEQQKWEQVIRLLDQGAKADKPQVDGMTAIHWSAFYNQRDVVSKLIKAGFQMNALTRYQVSPLSLACEYGNTESAIELIRSKADMESTRLGKETPLMYAARNGNLPIVKELLKHSVKIDAVERGGQTALMWGAANGHLAVVDELIQAGADINVRVKSSDHAAITFAAREGHAAVVMRLLAAGVDVNQIVKPEKRVERGPREGMSILMFAVESGHLELALELIKHGADPNDQRSGFAPLHAIIWVRRTELGDDENGDPAPRITGKYSSLDFVREIVKAGADVNCVLKEGSKGVVKFNTKGATPLLLAAKNADLPLIDLLLELGADPKITNVDETNVIMAAAGVGVIAVDEEPATQEDINQAIKRFVKLGIDINKVDKNRETAMHGAALRTFPETVKCLAVNGADPKIWNNKNKRGWTPFDIADGNRPGSVKPSPATRTALQQALDSSNPKIPAQN